MLDLQPRVHLQEEGFVALDDELHRAGVDVADGARGILGRPVQPLAQRVRQVGRRRLLDHLLMAALQRAVARVQMGDAAVAVAEHLHLHMARPLQVFLQQHSVIAEGGRGLASGAGQLCGEILRPQHRPHALAAAAGAGLNQNGEADARGLGRQQRIVLRLTMIARHGRHAGRHHQPLALGLAAHGANGGGRRADEGDAGIGAALREFRILRQETIAGVDRLRAGATRHVEDDVAAQVGLRGRRGADRVRLIRLPHMHGAGIGVGEDGDGADAHGARAADDAHGDLAAVGDEEGLDHIRNSPKRVASIGAWVAAASARPSTSRVMCGGMMPSSQSRAVA